MQWSDPTFTLTTASYTLVFNADTGDTYLNDPTQCAGLDGAPIRANIDDRPQTHGGILHPSFKGPRHITISGTLAVRSGTDDTSYVSARQALEDDLIAACDEILNTDGTLSWASAAKSLTVRCDIAPTYPGANLKTYLFGLVAADPTIS